MSKAICEGLTVLEFGTGMANSFAGMILSENGARVLKVEPPGGDPLRESFPTAFLVWNRGKESIVLDLHKSAAQREARKLARRADVVVEAFSTGTAELFGIGHEGLRKRNPRLVYCSIKGFGSKGAYARLKGYDGIVSAKAGLYDAAPFRPGPMFSNFTQGTHGASHMAVQGIIAALIVREQTGRGQFVEATLHQGLTSYDLWGMMDWHLAHRRPDLLAQRPTGISVGGGHLCTKDGRWVEFSSLLPHQFRAYIRALELESVWDDPRFQSAPNFAEVETAEIFRDLLFDRFKERTLAEWMPALLSENDLAFELLRTGEESLDHPQVIHNKAWIEIEDPEAGRMRQTGPLAYFSESASVIRNPSPALGQHAEIANARKGRDGAPRSQKAAPTHPLEGITIIELASFYQAPFGVTLAASLGARVIKIEELNGDPGRLRGEHVTVKRLEGKQSIAVNLRTPEGQDILHKLVAKADIFVYGFRPGIERNLGVEYETLRKINPHLVYVFAGGYGSSGPYSRRPMYGNTTLAMLGGYHRQAGEWLNPAIAKGQSTQRLKELARRLSVTFTAGQDPPAALGLGTVLLLAMYWQRRTNKGQYVESSMVNRNAHASADDFNSYSGKPPMPIPDPDSFGLHALYRLYPAKAGWVFLACPVQKEWEAFCAATDQDGLKRDRRFANGVDRKEHDQELAEALSQLFATKPAEEWEQLLAPRGIGCVQVFAGTTAEFNCTDPVIGEMGLVGEVDHPIFGRHLRHGLPVSLSETPGKLAPGCMVGQHTDEILAELGFTPDAIHDLKGAQVIASSG